MSPDDEFDREIARRLAAELDGASGPDPRWSEAPAAARVGRRPLGPRASLLVAAAIILGSSLLGVWLLSGGAVNVRPSPSTTPPATPDLAATLHRPLAIPALGPAGACPVTPVGLTLDSLGQFQGSGPVRVNDLNDVPIYELPYRDGWYGQKVFWAVDAREPGPILVRVERIDGQGEVGLGDGLTPELMLSSSPLDVYSVVGTPPPVPLKRIFIDGVSFRTPGCYVMQMDGPATTSTVVFRALGGSVNQPIGLFQGDRPVGTGPVGTRTCIGIRLDDQAYRTGGANVWWWSVGPGGCRTSTSGVTASSANLLPVSLGGTTGSPDRTGYRVELGLPLVPTGTETIVFTLDPDSPGPHQGLAAHAGGAIPGSDLLLMPVVALDVGAPGGGPPSTPRSP